MKQYFTGFFTAVCLTASVFIFMGQGRNDSQIGRYQISTNSVGTEGEILVSIYDTRDGSLFALNHHNYGMYHIDIKRVDE